MRGKTHLVVGVSLGIALAHINHLPLSESLLLGVSSGLGGLFPDIDHPQSLLGRFIPSGIKYRGWSRGNHNNNTQVGRNFGIFTLWHRGPTHSIGLGLITSFLIFLALQHLHFGLSILLAIAWFLGYMSHLFLDEFNRAPQMLLFPLRFKMIYLPFFPHVAQNTFSDKFLELIFVVIGVVYSIINLLPLIFNFHKWGL